MSGQCFVGITHVPTSALFGINQMSGTGLNTESYIIYEQSVSLLGIIIASALYKSTGNMITAK